MPQVSCPICALEGTTVERAQTNRVYTCRTCGNFAATSTLIAILGPELDQEPRKRAILSHAVRKMQRQDESPLINSYLKDRILEQDKLPAPAEQAENLILWLGDTLPAPGEKEHMEAVTHQAIMGAGSPANAEFVISHLVHCGLIAGEVSEARGRRPYAEGTLSFAGWQQYEELKRGRATSRRAFMAMEFGDAELDAVFIDVSIFTVLMKSRRLA